MLPTVMSFVSINILHFSGDRRTESFQHEIDEVAAEIPPTVAWGVIAGLRQGRRVARLDIELHGPISSAPAV